MLTDRQNSENCHYIRGDRRIHSPSIGQIESAALFAFHTRRARISTALSGVAFSDLYKATNCSSDVGRLV